MTSAAIADPPATVRSGRDSCGRSRPLHARLPARLRELGYEEIWVENWLAATRYRSISSGSATSREIVEDVLGSVQPDRFVIERQSGCFGMSQCLAYADRLFATATGHAACALEAVGNERDSYLVEKDLKVAMTNALRAQEADARNEVRIQLPHWNPQPGAFDIGVLREDNPTWLGELKWANDNKVYEALWDAVKVAAATELDAVAGGYLTYGASNAQWTKPVECAEIFEEGECPIVDLIRDHLAWWDKYILGDSTGRPVSSRARIDVATVSDIALNVQGKPWRIRTVRIEPAGEAVEFVDGRPV